MRAGGAHPSLSISDQDERDSVKRPVANIQTSDPVALKGVPAIPAFDPSHDNQGVDHGTEGGEHQHVGRAPVSRAVRLEVHRRPAEADEPNVRLDDEQRPNHHLQHLGSMKHEVLLLALRR
jgi:hypothetical protein